MYEYELCRSCDGDAHTFDCRASGIGDRMPPEAEPPPQAQPRSPPDPGPAARQYITIYMVRTGSVLLLFPNAIPNAPDPRRSRVWAVGLGFRIIIKRGRERSGTAMSVEPERGTVLASREVDRVAEPSASRSRSRGAQLRAVPRHDTTHKPSRAPKGPEGEGRDPCYARTAQSRWLSAARACLF